MDTFVLVLGYAASVVSCAVMLPQALCTFQRRNDPEAMRGVSLGTPVLMAANAVAWAVWAVLSGAYPAGLPSLIGLPTALVMIAVVRRNRAVVRDANATACDCGYPDPRADHVLFVTAAPGYGSVFECAGLPRKYAVPVARRDLATLRGDDADRTLRPAA